MLTEYVLSSDEFDSLIKGTPRFIIEQEPVTYTNVHGSGVMRSAVEVQLTVKVTGISKDKNPQRIIGLKIGVGIFNRYAEEYASKFKKLQETAQKEFPNAKPGVFM